MPIKIPDMLPARRILEDENVFVMGESRAYHQDIRALKILILNIMPVKVTTETQILRCLSNSPLQVDVELLRIASHESKNTAHEHLSSFYKTFEQVRYKRYDGMIITGAPVEQLRFEQVDYWPELTEIMEWTKTHVTNTFHICWGAQAALYYHYGIDKHPLAQKMFGIFEHKVVDTTEPLVRGFDDVFWAPHSRHTENRREDIAANANLKILAESDEAGVYIAISNDKSQIFVTGHSEYDRETLAGEYARDISCGLDIQKPRNYFPNDDPTQTPRVTWRSHANLLYSNWLNYYVYQMSPYEI